MTVESQSDKFVGEAGRGLRAMVQWTSEGFQSCPIKPAQINRFVHERTSNLRRRLINSEPTGMMPEVLFACKKLGIKPTEEDIKIFINS
jgi:hypothetical protein